MKEFQRDPFNVIKTENVPTDSDEKKESSHWTKAWSAINKNTFLSKGKMSQGELLK